jgi:hypothetical protein
MKKTLLALCLAAFTVVTAAANTDVAGSWKVVGDVYGNPVNFDCALKQDGEALTGTAKFDDGRETAVTGSVKEKTVSFEFDTDSAGTTYHLVFTGTVGDDGGLKGTIAVAGVEGTFTATKQAAQ